MEMTALEPSHSLALLVFAHKTCINQFHMRLCLHLDHKLSVAYQNGKRSKNLRGCAALLLLLQRKYSWFSRITVRHKGKTILI
jgi:hypothetical protein